MTTNVNDSPVRPSTDRIEKHVLLRAPRARVWRALSDVQEFGTWFRFRLDRAFAPGARVRATFAAPGKEHISVEMMIERMEPERYFSYRWHPYALDPAVDYSQEPTTLVEFTLEEAPEGTALTIVESGFDALPVARRDEAFRMNDRGWDNEVRNLAAYVT